MTERRLTQCQRIAAYMRDIAIRTNPLTQVQCTEKFKCTRLAARISDIKTKGVIYPGDEKRSWPKVQDVSILITPEDGPGCNIKGYWIEAEMKPGLFPEFRGNWRRDVGGGAHR